MGIKKPKENGSAKYNFEWALKILKKKEPAKYNLKWASTILKKRGQRNITFNGH